MGKGSDYSGKYRHFMLFDMSSFNVDDDFDDNEYSEFKDEIQGSFDSKHGVEFLPRQKSLGDDAHIFADCDLFSVGIDTGGGLACVFVTPKTYDNGNEEVPYRIDGSVQNAFNCLIADRPEFFKFPTSDFTSEVLTSYDRVDD